MGMRTTYYAYRRKSDGLDFWKGQRPYCTKGAALVGLPFGSIDKTPEEIAAYQAKYRFPSPRWRYPTLAERKAMVARDYDLITYELREVAQ